MAPRLLLQMLAPERLSPGLRKGFLSRQLRNPQGVVAHLRGLTLAAGFGVRDLVQRRLNQPGRFGLFTDRRGTAQTDPDSTSAGQVSGQHGHLTDANNAPIHVRQVDVVIALQIGFQRLAVILKQPQQSRYFPRCA